MIRRFFPFTIAQGGVVEERFVISVKTDNAGTSSSNQFTIPTGAGTFNYTVETSDGHNVSGLTGNYTITFSGAGTYDVFISGTFPYINFNNGGDRLKLLEIKNWGTIAWGNLNTSFFGCANMELTATDVPDLTSITGLQSTFRACTTMTGLSANWLWDTSGIVSTSNMCDGSTNFNGDISTWDMSVNQSMSAMLRNTAFNRDIGSWTTTALLNIANMLQNADSFDQSLAGWTVPQITTMTNFMVSATGLSTANYDATLISWAAQIPLAATTVSFGGSQYTSGGAAATARANLVADGLAISDGGAV